MTPSSFPSRVLIAGGGLAGIEAALALRELAGDRAAVTVIDPRPRFGLPATAAGRAFGIGFSPDPGMSEVARRAGARSRRGRLVAVDGRRRIAMLAGGELMPYDRLILAVGGRPVPAVSDALTFRGHADADELRALVDGIGEAAGRGASCDLAVVAPRRCAWPLAAYEIALMAREHLDAAGAHDGACRITVVTAEERPLSAFASPAGDGVLRTLARAGVAVRAGAPVRAFRWGRLELEDGQTIPADRVVALPTVVGPAIEGLPSDADGFVTCTAEGLVPGVPDVRVVGDARAGGDPALGAHACRQADRAALAIARELGAPLPADVLADVDPAPQGGADGPLPWPVQRVPGRYLAPLVAELSRPLVAA